MIGFNKLSIVNCVLCQYVTRRMTAIAAPQQDDAFAAVFSRDVSTGGALRRLSGLYRVGHTAQDRGPRRCLSQRVQDGHSEKRQKTTQDAPVWPPGETPGRFLEWKSQPVLLSWLN